MFPLALSSIGSECAWQDARLLWCVFRRPSTLQRCSCPIVLLSPAAIWQSPLSPLLLASSLDAFSNITHHTHCQWKALKAVNLVLIDACKEGQTELVKAMLDCGADKEAHDVIVGGEAGGPM